MCIEEPEVVTRGLGLQLQFQEIKATDDLNRAFEAITKARPGALMVAGGPFGTTNQQRIVEFAVKSRLPVIYYRRESVESGGLMSYHANCNHLSRRAATYVDKILKGAKPADLPVDQPTKFELVVNFEIRQRSAGFLRMFSRADRVIR